MLKKNQRVTKPKFIKALDGSAGIYSVMAGRLGVHRRTVYTFVEKNNLKHLVDEEREKLIDKAEVQLIKLVEKGDWKAIDKVLSTIGKDRGYIERTEQAIEVTGNLDIKRLAELARTKYEGNSKEE